MNKLQLAVVSALVVLSVGCGRPSGTPDAGCVGINCPLVGGGTGGGLGGGTGGAQGGGTGGGTGGAQGGGTGGAQGGGTGGGTGGAQGGGTGGGTGGAQGGGTGGGNVIPTTIMAAKGSSYPAEVNLQGVVVTAVSFARPNTTSGFCATPAADGGQSRGTTTDFWVADPNNPQQGVWVEKFRCDGVDIDYSPTVGDILNIGGVIGFESFFQQQSGYRVMVKSQFDYIQSRPMGYVCAPTSTPPCIPLEIVKTGSMAPLPPVDVPTTFGANGAIKAEPTYAGARIKIAGPLTVGNLNPPALQLIAANVNTTYYGFELSNGVLVSNFRTRNGFTYEDGGAANCDVRAIVGDGGTITFPNGIAGVWDSYTHSPCADGGSNPFSCGSLGNVRGYVPGTPDANFTNILYPTDCSDFTP